MEELGTNRGALIPEPNPLTSTPRCHPGFWVLWKHKAATGFWNKRQWKDCRRKETGRTLRVSLPPPSSLSAQCGQGPWLSSARRSGWCALWYRPRGRCRQRYAHGVRPCSLSPQPAGWGSGSGEERKAPLEPQQHLRNSTALGALGSEAELAGLAEEKCILVWRASDFEFITTALVSVHWVLGAMTGALAASLDWIP